MSETYLLNSGHFFGFFSVNFELIQHSPSIATSRTWLKPVVCKSWTHIALVLTLASWNITEPLEGRPTKTRWLRVAESLAYSHDKRNLCMDRLDYNKKYTRSHHLPLSSRLPWKNWIATAIQTSGRFWCQPGNMKESKNLKFHIQAPKCPRLQFGVDQVFVCWTFDNRRHEACKLFKTKV